MGWGYLILAIIFEVFGTTMMKLSNGLSNSIPSVLMFVGYIASFAMLAIALKTIDVSVAYAIWSAIGIILISIIGIFYFGESVSLAKVISILVIITGVVSLKLCTQ